MRISDWSSDVCSSDLDLDLNPILAKVDAPDDQRRFSLTKWRNPVPDSLDAQMMKDARAVFERGEKMQLTYTVRNTHRAVGTRLSAAVTERFGMSTLADGHLTVRLRGSAGQSLDRKSTRLNSRH